MRRLATRVTAAVLVLASPASAAGGDDTRRAEGLYDEALTLLDRGDVAAACPKLEESQRLDPALGTQWNLADCYGRSGRLASALLLFGDVATAARAAGKANLASNADGRARSLDPRVGRLRLALAPAEERVVVRVDGALMNATPPRIVVPLNRGKHEVEVSAPEKRAWRTSIDIADGRIVDVEVPVLAPIVASPAPTPKAERPSAPERSTAVRVAAAGLAGAGLVGIGVGAVFGAIALSRRDDARSLCGNDDPRAPCRSPDGVSRWHDAKVAGNASTVALACGGVLALGAGAVWLLGKPSSPSRAAIAPVALPGGAGMAMTGRLP